MGAVASINGLFFISCSACGFLLPDVKWPAWIYEIGANGIIDNGLYSHNMSGLNRMVVVFTDSSLLGCYTM
jgi:hypothetical protein